MNRPRDRIAFGMRDVCLGLALLLVGAAPALSATITLTLPNLEGAAGKEVAVPISVTGAKGLSALYVRVTYDPAVLEVVKDASDPDKAITKGKILPENALFRIYTTSIPGYKGDGDKLVPGDPIPVKPGGLPLVFAGGTNKQKKEYYSVQEDGTLATIRFRVIGEPGKKSPLGFESAEAFQSDDMAMLVKTEPGELIVTRGIPSLWIAIAVGIVVLLFLMFLVLRRRTPQQSSSASAAMGGGAGHGGQIPVFQPESATFQYRCTKCGGTLTLPVIFAGKQIKCSACGTTQAAMP